MSILDGKRWCPILIFKEMDEAVNFENSIINVLVDLFIDGDLTPSVKTSCGYQLLYNIFQSYQS